MRYVTEKNCLYQNPGRKIEVVHLYRPPQGNTRINELSNIIFTRLTRYIQQTNDA